MGWLLEVGIKGGPQSHSPQPEKVSTPSICSLAVVETAGFRLSAGVKKTRVICRINFAMDPILKQGYVLSAVTCQMTIEYLTKVLNYKRSTNAKVTE